LFLRRLEIALWERNANGLSTENDELSLSLKKTIY